MGRNSRQRRAAAARKRSDSAEIPEALPPNPPPVQPKSEGWRYRWGKLVRAGETAVWLALVGMSYAAALGGDTVGAAVCLIGAAVVGTLAVSEERKLKFLDALGIGVMFSLLSCGGYYWDWEHRPQVQTINADEIARTVLNAIEPKLVASPNSVEHNSGFVQLDQTELYSDQTKLVAGQPFKMGFSFSNRGGRPVRDAQTWGGFVIADPAINTDEHIKKIFKDSIIAGYQKFAQEGQSMGVNGGGWNTAVSAPITQAQIDGISFGKLRMWFLIGAAWTDEDGLKHTDTWCSWPVNVGPSGDLAGRSWKTCG